MRKKAPLTVERKNSKGGFASEQTPHPSSCPPLAADRPRPFRCSSFSHTNRFAGFAWEPCPFANPLKTTKKGAAAPLPWIFPGVRFVLKLFQLCKTRYRCGFGKPARLSKYSASVLTSIRQIFNGRKKAICTAYRALGKPDSTAARRAF